MKNFTIAAVLLFAATCLFSCSKGSPGTPDSGNNNNVTGGNSTIAPVAGFSCPFTGLASATLSFTNTSLYATSYSWDFGDGTSSTLSNPTHVYSTGGIYTVTLTATNSKGSNSATASITINNPTSAKILSVKITSLPFVDPSCTCAWSSTGAGPDVFFKLTYVPTNTLVTTSGTINNVVPASLPLNYISTTTFPVINNFYNNYTLNVYNQYFATAQFMAGYTFNLTNQTLAGYPTTVILNVPPSALTVQINLQWQ